MADLKAAFMRTPWSKPQVSSQPAGNTTLVNLTTFYKVNWAVEGFQPGEVDRSVLRGIPVQIRPKLVGFTYVFGDGSTVGPTTSTGGVYPSGDITHVYRTKGEYPVRVDTTFGADFSLDGSTWDEIPSTVTVRVRRRPSRFVRPRACSSTTDQHPLRRGPTVTVPSGSERTIPYRRAARPAHRSPPLRRGADARQVTVRCRIRHGRHARVASPLRAFGQT